MDSVLIFAQCNISVNLAYHSSFIIWVSYYMLMENKNLMSEFLEYSNQNSHPKGTGYFFLYILVSLLACFKPMTQNKKN